MIFFVYHIFELIVFVVHKILATDKIRRVCVCVCVLISTVSDTVHERAVRTGVHFNSIVPCVIS